MSERDLTIRPATDADLNAILALLKSSMQRMDDARFEDLFRWKHLENPFGRSPAWVACDGEAVVGLRVFMRWEFEFAGDVVRAVRAVDTATHPDYQGRGIFTKLTLGGLPLLAADGVSFVFNTPNDKSRPGYLKMGWSLLGRLRASVRPMTAARTFTIARARVPAAHWSEPAQFGEPASDFLVEHARELADLIAARSISDRYRTRVTPEFLAWRYGSSVLEYRVVVGTGGVEDGVAFVRVRRRGPARELAVAHFVATKREAGARRRLAHSLRDARAETDYALALGRPVGFIPLPRQGPILAARSLQGGDGQVLKDFDLSLGDVELF